MSDKLDLLKEILSEDEKKDSLQFGSSGERIKIYFNASNPKEMKEKIENQLGLIEYAKVLEESVDKGELLDDFLDKAEAEDDNDG